MSSGRFDEITVLGATVLRTSDKALLVEVDGSETWVPKSQLKGKGDGVLTEESEQGDTGKLVLPRWLAEEKEFEGEENDEG